VSFIRAWSLVRIQPGLLARKQMKIFIAFVQDRHTDPELRAFHDKEDAKYWARHRFRQVVHRPQQIKEEDAEGYELYLRYMEEGDYAFVIESELEPA
jgi:hypothetical protein